MAKKLPAKQEVISVREIDQGTGELVSQFLETGFKPSIVVGSTRGGSILGRIIAHKIGCGFLSFPLSSDELEEVYSTGRKLSRRWDILLVDDVNLGGNVACFIKIMKELEPSVDEELVLEGFFHNLIDYVAEVFTREPDNLTYDRKWLFQKEALKQIVPTSVAEDAINNAVDLIRKENKKSIEKMLEAYGRKDKPKTAPKNAKAIKEIIERLKKNKKNDISTGMLAGFLESKLLRCPNRNASRLLKNIEVRTCAFYNGQDPYWWLDYSLRWPVPRALPWRSDKLRSETFISDIRKSKVSWAEDAAEEIRKQSETEADRPPRFYLAYPFNEPINAINDPGTKVTDLIYEFMVIDESRTLPESFLRWCEVNGFKFYRKSDTEGCLHPGIRSIKNCFDYSFMSHKDLYLLKLRPNELMCSEGSIVCPKNRMCKIKANEEEDLECILCNNFKESFSALFGKDKLGFYQWLDRKGLITNVEYQIYLDNIKVKTVSKADLLQLAKELEEK